MQKTNQYFSHNHCRWFYQSCVQTKLNWIWSITYVNNFLHESWLNFPNCLLIDSVLLNSFWKKKKKINITAGGTGRWESFLIGQSKMISSMKKRERTDISSNSNGNFNNMTPPKFALHVTCLILWTMGKFYLLKLHIICNDMFCSILFCVLHCGLTVHLFVLHFLFSWCDCSNPIIIFAFHIS